MAHCQSSELARTPPGSRRRSRSPPRSPRAPPPRAPELASEVTRARPRSSPSSWRSTPSPRSPATVVRNRSADIGIPFGRLGLRRRERHLAAALAAAPLARPCAARRTIPGPRSCQPSWRRHRPAPVADEGQRRVDPLAPGGRRARRSGRASPRSLMSSAHSRHGYAERRVARAGPCAAAPSASSIAARSASSAGGRQRISVHRITSARVEQVAGVDGVEPPRPDVRGRPTASFAARASQASSRGPSGVAIAPSNSNRVSGRSPTWTSADAASALLRGPPDGAAEEREVVLLDDRAIGQRLLARRSTAPASRRAAASWSCDQMTSSSSPSAVEHPADERVVAGAGVRRVGRRRRRGPPSSAVIVTGSAAGMEVEAELRARLVGSTPDARSGRRAVLGRRSSRGRRRAACRAPAGAGSAPRFDACPTTLMATANRAPSDLPPSLVRTIPNARRRIEAAACRVRTARRASDGPVPLSFGAWPSPIAGPVDAPRAASTPRVAGRSRRPGRASSSASCARRWRRAKFDDLPYQGERIPMDDDAAAGDWAMAFRMLRNAGAAPPWIEADKEVRRCSSGGTRCVARARRRGRRPARRRRSGGARGARRRGQRRDRPPQRRGADRPPASPPARPRRELARLDAAADR